MRDRKTLIFEIQNLLFGGLVKIFEKSEIKIFKILKESPSNYILIEEGKEEIISFNVKKFSFILKISTNFFEEEKLKEILNSMHKITEILKENFLNIKVIGTEVKSPLNFKGFEAKVNVIIFA